MNYDKTTFEAIARKHIKRDGLETLLDKISKTDFYEAPASTKYHGAEKGGLCKHSISVAEQMTKEISGTDITMESAVIVALFHDLCKIGFYKDDVRNVKENGVWKQVPYYSVEDKFPIGHGEKSVIMVLPCMELTTDEILAIRWHMGGFVAKDDYNALSTAYGMSALAVLLHCADLKSTYITKA